LLALLPTGCILLFRLSCNSKYQRSERQIGLNKDIQTAGTGQVMSRMQSKIADHLRHE